MMQPRTIAAHTLGCKLNFAETSQLLRQAEEEGYRVVDFHEKADVYVINTCTVTATAERKCRTVIRQAVHQNRDAVVAVVGCFAQNDAAQIRQIEGVTLVLGNEDKHRLLDILGQRAPRPVVVSEPRSFSPAYSGDDRTRTFFKVQEGCDYFCTYCAIPRARGRSRSADVATTMAVAQRIADSGAKEVVLTGVNTGTFGQHTGESLMQLMQQLDLLPGIERFRISSIEPNLLTSEMIRFVANSRRFAPHFHIPLQAGSDKVLRLMHRRYSTAEYADKLFYIRSLMPDACIAADVMVGFNGEDEATFEQTVDFLTQLPLCYLHVFPYSERPGTAALGMAERVPREERYRRSAVLHQLSDAKKRAFYMQGEDKVHRVLWEAHNHGGYMLGFTGNYLRARRPYDPALVGTVQQVRLQTFHFEEELFDVALTE